MVAKCSAWPFAVVLQNKAPDIIFLDEPVNNLDLSNIQMLAKIFSGYQGTLIVISHDKGFRRKLISWRNSHYRDNNESTRLKSKIPSSNEGILVLKGV